MLSLRQGSLAVRMETHAESPVEMMGDLGTFKEELFGGRASLKLSIGSKYDDDVKYTT